MSFKDLELAKFGEHHLAVDVVDRQRHRLRSQRVAVVGKESQIKHAMLVESGCPFKQAVVWIEEGTRGQIG